MDREAAIPEHTRQTGGPALRIFVGIGAVAIGILLTYAFVVPQVRKAPIDFAQFYFAGQLVAEGNVARIYDPTAYAPLAARVRAQTGEVSPYHYFNRPAFAALLCWPLTLLSFEVGSRLVIVLNLTLWGLLVWKLPTWLGSPGFLRVWLFSFFPFLGSVAYGQDTLAITLLVAYGCFVLLPRNELLAGSILALCLVKPHLTALLPVYLLIEGRKRAALAFFVTGAVLAGLSFALIGPHGVAQWLHLLSAPTTDHHPENMGNLRAIGLQFGTPAVVVLGIVVAFSAAVVFLRGSSAEKLSTALIVSLLVSPHTYWQDYSLLSILALSTTDRAVRYVLLLPWRFLLPVFALWPTTLAVAACIARVAIQRIPKRKSNSFAGKGEGEGSHLRPSY